MQFFRRRGRTIFKSRETASDKRYSPKIWTNLRWIETNIKERMRRPTRKASDHLRVLNEKKTVLEVRTLRCVDAAAPAWPLNDLGPIPLMGAPGGPHGQWNGRPTRSIGDSRESTGDEASERIPDEGGVVERGPLKRKICIYFLNNVALSYIN